MKKTIMALLGFLFLLTITACSQTSINAQSAGGESVEEALTQYAKAWANIDYNSYTGREILPYVTKEWGQEWYDKISRQYIDVYKQQKIIREFSDVEISGIMIDGDSASAVVTIYSKQKSPSEKSCADLPVSVSLVKVGNKWFINGTVNE